MTMVELEVLGQELRPGRFLASTFDVSDAFGPRYWWMERMKGPGAWCRFTEGGHEVARAKVQFDFTVSAPYPTLRDTTHRMTHIELLAVRDTEQGRGLGSAAVQRLTEAFLPPFVAFSKNAASDAFWRSIGWQEHLHAEHHDTPVGCQHLFHLPGR